MGTATIGARTIDDDLLPLLSGMEFDGPIARLNCGQLDRKTYERVNKVIEALGGKWNRGKKGHLFAECPEEVIADAVAAGQYVDAKKQFQCFETPDFLADKIVDWAGLRASLSGRCLEPSAGGGALVRAIKRATTDMFVCAVECNAKMRDGLSCVADEVVITDFMTASPGDRYDFVIMNPPFTRSQDIAHVRHAFGFLGKGGVLVAIMSPGFTFRTDRKAVEFREWFESLGGEIRKNDAGAFKESGTMVNTITVRIEKA